MFECEQPPPIRLLNLRDIGDTYVSFQWNETRPAEADLSYSYEIRWKPLDVKPTFFHNPPTLPSPADTTKLVLSASQQSLTIGGLRPNGNYSLSIRSFNNCAWTAPLSVNFATISSQDERSLSPPAMLPHELLLTGLVLLVWAILIRHFLRTYRRITLVNSMPLAGYLDRRKSSLESGGDPRRDSKFSDASTKSKVSNGHTHNHIHSQFELLEEAVHKWRSETMLSPKLLQEHGGKGAAPKESHNFDFSTTHKQHWGATRLHSIACPRALPSFRPYAESCDGPVPVVRIEIGSPEEIVSTSCAVEKHIPQMHSSHSLPAFQLEQEKAAVIENPLNSTDRFDTNPPSSGSGTAPIVAEKRVKTAKNPARTGHATTQSGKIVPSLQRRRSSYYAPRLMIPNEDGTVPRKVMSWDVGAQGVYRMVGRHIRVQISEVLLGKATKDIRRCSTITGLDAKQLARLQKRSRRSSYSSSLRDHIGSLQKRLSLRKRLQNRESRMTSLREEEKETSPGPSTSLLGREGLRQRSDSFAIIRQLPNRLRRFSVWPQA